MTGACPAPSAGTFNALVWLSGVVSGFLIQLIVRLFVTRAAGIQARTDELCDAVRSLASASHEYWSLEPDDPGVTKAEAELSAANHIMNCLAGIVIELKPSLKGKLSDAVFALSNDATGSNFQVHNRAADVYRYRTVQGRAMIILGDLRRFQQGTWVRTFG